MKITLVKFFFFAVAVIVVQDVKGETEETSVNPDNAVFANVAEELEKEADSDEKTKAELECDDGLNNKKELCKFYKILGENLKKYLISGLRLLQQPYDLTEINKECTKVDDPTDEQIKAAAECTSKSIASAFIYDAFFNSGSVDLTKDTTIQDCKNDENKKNSIECKTIGNTIEAFRSIIFGAQKEYQKLTSENKAFPTDAEYTSCYNYETKKIATKCEKDNKDNEQEQKKCVESADIQTVQEECLIVQRLSEFAEILGDKQIKAMNNFNENEIPEEIAAECGIEKIPKENCRVGKIFLSVLTTTFNNAVDEAKKKGLLD